MVSISSVTKSLLYPCSACPIVQLNIKLCAIQVFAIHSCFFYSFSDLFSHLWRTHLFLSPPILISAWIIFWISTYFPFVKNVIKSCFHLCSWLPNSLKDFIYLTEYLRESFRFNCPSVASLLMFSHQLYMSSIKSLPFL